MSVQKSDRHRISHQPIDRTVPAQLRKPFVEVLAFTCSSFPYKIVRYDPSIIGGPSKLLGSILKINVIIWNSSTKCSSSTSFFDVFNLLGSRGPR